MDRILIVEDDPTTARAVEAEVLALGCSPTWVGTWNEGLAEATSGTLYAVIVLDRMLPGGDGITAISHIRAAGVQSPVLILSALGRSGDRVEGLDRGADDYLSKPFVPEELRARLRALLRRGAVMLADTDLLVLGDLEIRQKARTVHVRRSHVATSPREFDLITYLARNAGSVVTRMQLLEQVWNLHFDPGTNVVDVHVGRLRRKLEEVGCHLIQTARGEGYVLGPVAPQPQPQP